MSNKVRRKRAKDLKKKLSNRVTQEGLDEIGRMAKLVSDLIKEEVADGANPYAAAIALECQVQSYCRQTGAGAAQLAKTAVDILDDPRIRKPVVVKGEQKKVEEKPDGGKSP